MSWQQRPPAVAGSFYPATAEQLRRELSRYYRQEKEEIIPSPPNWLLAPHAGLTFAGITAAAAFRQFANHHWQRAILLGPSHHFPLRQAVLDNSDSWLTPLGPLSLDREFSQQLAQKANFIRQDWRPHRPEHSLEMLAIWLRFLQPKLTIVPILVTQLKPREQRQLGQLLAQLSPRGTILLTSSDLSHYPAANLAQKIDRQTSNLIQSGRPNLLRHWFQQIEKQNLPGLVTAACGQTALLVSLEYGREKQLHYRQLAYHHSGEVNADREHVVGYLASGGWPENP